MSGMDIITLISPPLDHLVLLKCDARADVGLRGVGNIMRFRFKAVNPYRVRIAQSARSDAQVF